MNYNLNKVDTNNFAIALEDATMIGENIVNGSIEEVMQYLNDFKDNASEQGEGELVLVESNDLINITIAKWYLLIDKEVQSNYMIILTSNDELYSLPTNKEAYSGSLGNILQRINELENG